MIEIRVAVPDALAASDLTWHVQERAEIFHDGTGHTVRLTVPPADRHSVLDAIRDWVALRGLGAVEVEVAGDRLTVGA